MAFTYFSTCSRPDNGRHGDYSASWSEYRREYRFPICGGNAADCGASSGCVFDSYHRLRCSYFGTVYYLSGEWIEISLNVFNISIINCDTRFLFQFVINIHRWWDIIWISLNLRKSQGSYWWNFKLWKTKINSFYLFLFCVLCLIRFRLVLGRDLIL